MPFKYASMAERIIANSRVDEERAHGGSFCWTWIGRVTTNRSGIRYGTITTRMKRGPRKGKVVTHYAHRMAVKHLKNRIITPKMVVMHLCNWSLCVNPAHLVGGTQKKNVRQCVKDGRHRNGASK